MGIFSAGRETTRDIPREQSQARMQGANESTRPNQVTMADLRAKATKRS